jgi:CDP-diglyceride synthetase
MDLRTFFYKHPFANMVTIVFLFSLVVLAFYFFGMIPGVRKTLPELSRLLTIVGVLLVVTAASWIVAIGLDSGDL